MRILYVDFLVNLFYFSFVGLFPGLNPPGAGGQSIPGMEAGGGMSDIRGPLI